MSIASVAEQLIDEMDDPFLQRAFRALDSNDVKVIENFLNLINGTESGQRFYNDVIDCNITTKYFKTVMDFSKLVYDFDVYEYSWYIEASERDLELFKSIVVELQGYDEEQLKIFYEFKRFCDRFVDEA